MSRTVPVVDYARFPARVRMLLEVDGYEAIGEVADRATAMTKVRRLRPGLVLLDVQLPQRRRLRRRRTFHRRPRRPAVLLTSSRDWSDSADLILRGGEHGFPPKDRRCGAVAEVLA